MHVAFNDIITVKNSNVHPEPHGPEGGADLRFISPQPDTSWSCRTADTGLENAWYVHLLYSFCWYSLTDPGDMARWVGIGTQ